MRTVRVALTIGMIVGIQSVGCSVGIEQLYACFNGPPCTCPVGEIGTALCRDDGTFERCLCTSAGDASVNDDADVTTDTTVDLDMASDLVADLSADPDVAADSDATADLVVDPDVDQDREDSTTDADALTADPETEPPVCDGVISDPFDDGDLSACWTSIEIGGGLAGSDDETTSLIINANGADFWNSFDQFRLVYQPLCGDISVTLQVNYVPAVHEWAKSGVMIRESLTPESTHAVVLIARDNNYSFQYRSNTGQNTQAEYAGIFSNNPSDPIPGYVRIIRNGDRFRGEYSSDAETWSQVGGEATITMANCVYVGIASTSHTYGVLGTASFNDFTVESGGARE